MTPARGLGETQPLGFQRQTFVPQNQGLGFTYPSANLLSFDEFKQATNPGMQMHNLQSSEPAKNPNDNSVQKII